MDPKLSFSYVQILDSARLRHVLKQNEIDFDKVFEELNVVHSDPISPKPFDSIEELEKELAEQKERFDNAIKFKYMITRLTLTRRMTPTMKYFMATIGHLIFAEQNAYQNLLNYLEIKKSLMASRKNVHWNDSNWPEADV
jgi:hypothetical protein